MTDPVARFEQEFARYVGAEFAIALVNGTSTLHTALAALGVGPGSKVAVPPLTHAATTMAVLHAGAQPVFVDVDERTWLMDALGAARVGYQVPVSLYGLNYGVSCKDSLGRPLTIDDAAQTLRRHDGRFAFTSFSFQASKILPLGEGGMLTTNNEYLASEARSFSSLGYPMEARQPRIGKAALKHPAYARHYRLGYNYRLNPLVAERGLEMLGLRTMGMPPGKTFVERAVAVRQMCADMYRAAIQGCTWLTPQHVPDGYGHCYWTYAVATDTPERCLWLLDAMERHGGERPYPAWLITYREPAFRYLAADGTCPVAESLQPRLIQFQCNDLDSAARNARALLECLDEAGA